VHIAYMNFISTGVQKPEVMTLLPLGASRKPSSTSHRRWPRRKRSQGRRLDAKRSGADVRAEAHKPHAEVTYDFSPDPRELLDELLPLTVKTAFFQAFLDATTSEHVARMVAMKSATDNADKMQKALTDAIQPRPSEPDHDGTVGDHGWGRSDEGMRNLQRRPARCRRHLAGAVAGAVIASALALLGVVSCC
jgi:hypothetical protein